MKKYQEFDAVNCPLTGTVLVEASAGSGKTYNITRIFLRLLLEQDDITVKDILVVTFTQAATQELRNRLRNTLREALDCMDQPDKADNDLRSICARRQPVTLIQKKLKAGIRDFDEAAIYTIHGFCYRVLADFALETGNPFNMELVTNQDHLFHEIIMDFQRLNLYHESLLFIDYINKPSKLADIAVKLKQYISRKGMKFLPETVICDKTSVELAYQQAFQQAREIWDAESEHIGNIIKDDPGLNRKTYSVKHLPGKLNTMDKLMNDGADHYPDNKQCEILEYFSEGKISKSHKKNHTAPRHRFFTACETLKQAYQKLDETFSQCFTAMKQNLFHYLQAELERRNRERNTQGFDELLLGVHRAISGEYRNLLVEKISQRYRAALIDEFQDTDPMQYDIFSTFFKEAPLFLIGDPKQAIYGFRGADIFSYLKAALNAPSRFTLTRNWRSTPKLVKIVNLFFHQSPRPFVLKEIGFSPGSAAKSRATQGLILDELKEMKRIEQWRRQFYLWHFDLETDTGWTKQEAMEQIPQIIAAEIAKLVGMGKKNTAFIEEKKQDNIERRPLREEDIAVIVRRNQEAELMREALSAFNIPSVLHGTENVLNTHEAMELERLICAAVFPHDERKVKAALVTDLLGINANELDRFIQSESELEIWFDKFRDYAEQWRSHSFMRMFTMLLSREGVRRRLSQFDNGERRITNLLHLSEIIHNHAAEKHLSPLEILKWFREQRNPSTASSEENLLRLSTDDHAVKLITVHKSKGLEYPIVFLPFMWRTYQQQKSDVLLFHDPENDYETVLDFGSSLLEKHQQFYKLEQLSENLRQLYVALTRAQYRCYLVMPISGKHLDNPTDYLIHQPITDVLSPSSLEDKASLTEGLPRYQAFLERLDLYAQVEKIPESQPEPLPFIMPATIQYRQFKRRVDFRYRIASFSSLVLRREAGFHEPERDPEAATETPVEATEQDEPYNIFMFPRGAAAGTFLHELFEQIDFANNDYDSISELIANKLKNEGYDAEWLETLVKMVRNTLTVPLDPDDPAFTLSAIDKTHCIKEMGFYFPLRKITPTVLSRLLANARAGTLPQNFPLMIEHLEFSTVEGYMRGFIDLIIKYKDRYYLLDWKSNYLGSRIENYGSENMSAAMTSHYYILQYLIYTAALDQYLKYRIPNYRYETHFGGVRYLFLRGINPRAGCEYGVYRDLPDVYLIEKLNWELIRV